MWTGYNFYAASGIIASYTTQLLELLHSFIIKPVSITSYGKFQDSTLI
jgi:hypothetical protein